MLSTLSVSATTNDEKYKRKSRIDIKVEKFIESYYKGKDLDMPFNVNVLIDETTQTMLEAKSDIQST